MAGNESLIKAKNDRENEYYTQIADIEDELKHYRKHFKGKTVLCNCDDPFESNFFKYFVLNFNRLGLKKLITTCYAGSPVSGTQLDLSEFIDMKGWTEKKPKSIPHKAIVTTVYDKDGDGGIDLTDIKELFKSGENELSRLKGDGDFASEECLKLMDEADIVCTNPPFSLIRDYVKVLMEHEKKFLIIGTQNLIHYKETFPLIRDGLIWTGYNHVKEFKRPDGTIKVFGNIIWYTNLDIKKRHEDLILVKKYRPENYPKYINFDAIDVKNVSDIPYDYPGMMGVSDNFLESFNPSQFEIIGLAESSLGREIGFSANLTEEECKQLYHENRSFRRGNPIFRGADGKLHKPFSRVIIRNKNPERPKGKQ